MTQAMSEEASEDHVLFRTIFLELMWNAPQRYALQYYVPIVIKTISFVFGK